MKRRTRALLLAATLVHLATVAMSIVVVTQLGVPALGVVGEKR